MVMTISPQFESEVKKHFLGGRLVLIHTVGLWLGASGLFLLVSSLGSYLLGGTDPRLLGLFQLVFAVACLTYGVSYLLSHPLPVPSSRWQVPRLWREVFAPTTLYFLYGVGLGITLLTAVTTALPYAALAVIASNSVPLVPVVAAGAYAVGRATSLMVSSSRSVTGDGVVAWVADRRPMIAKGSGILLIGLGILATMDVMARIPALVG